MSPTRRLLALASVVSLGWLVQGCATHAPDGNALMSEWHAATVDRLVAVGEATPLVAEHRDCRIQPLEPDTQPAGWMLVHYRHPPGIVYRVVPVAEGMQFKPSDNVYLRSHHCNEPRPKP